MNLRLEYYIKCFTSIISYSHGNNEVTTIRTEITIDSRHGIEYFIIVQTLFVVENSSRWFMGMLNEDMDSNDLEDG